MTFRFPDPALRDAAYKAVDAKMRKAEKDEPTTFIQWKGTSVCIDVHCVCGFHSHWDKDFLYGLKCPGCDRYWRLGTQIQMVETTPEQAEALGCTEEQTLEDFYEGGDERDELEKHRQKLGLPPLPSKEPVKPPEPFLKDDGVVKYRFVLGPLKK